MVCLWVLRFVLECVCEGEVVSRVQVAMERLKSLNDSQSALYLLRVSYGIVRATHFMRTTPLAHWEEHAREFDRGVRDAAEAILGSVFDDRSYAQASVAWWPWSSACR